MEEQLVEKGGKKKYITERMEEAPENSKESSHSAQANGRNEQPSQPQRHWAQALVVLLYVFQSP
jgi:hypothetical protein